jgi:hypothetical protein
MKSKEIGIINLFYSNVNYGAVLQAYALQEHLVELGYNAKVINFRNFSRLPYRAIWALLKSFIFPNPFEKFRQKYIRLTSVFFWPFQIKKIIPKFDTFIVGSDQVWRPLPKAAKLKNKHNIFFLGFVPYYSKRIAYAASFGLSKWDDNGNSRYTEIIKNELQKFNSISVRELSAITICKEIFNVNAVQVLDPTLLIGRDIFDKIIVANNVSSSEIIYYNLDSCSDFNLALEFLSKKLQKEIKNIYYKSHKKIFNSDYFDYYSVDEWLSQIKNAEIVITDSYHCVCFCILFEKEFIYYPNITGGMTRIESLLGTLDLLDRIYLSYDDIKKRFDWKQRIDYKKVNNILSSERLKSNEFLNESLSKQ